MRELKWQRFCPEQHLSVSSLSYVMASPMVTAAPVLLCVRGDRCCPPTCCTGMIGSKGR